MKDIILIGFGGHAKSVIDTIEMSSEFNIIGYTDVENRGLYHGYAWLGNDEVLNDYFEKGIKHCFICMGYMGKGRVIDSLYKKVKDIGYNLPVIIDKSSVISKDVQIGEGTYIGKLSVVNADSRIGKMCIINTGVIVEHENLINDFTHVAVGATLCGRVTIGTHCLVGANSTVIQNVSIENEVIIGSGSVVLHDVLKSGTFYGVI